MVSLTVDPKTDTPKVLAQYVERFAVGPGYCFSPASRRSSMRSWPSWAMPILTRTATAACCSSVTGQP